MNSAWTDYLQNKELRPLKTGISAATRFFAAHDDDAFLSVRGKDASRFLQSQLSSDVSGLAVNESQMSSYSSPKGLVYTTFRVYRLADQHFYLRLSRSLAVAIGKRLKMYVLRDEVEVDIDENLGALSLIGIEAEQWFTARGTGVPTRNGQICSTEFGWLLRSSTLTGDDGSTLPHFECLVSNDHLDPLWSELALEWPSADPAAAELARILSGEPQLTQKTTEQFVAQSLNLHLNGGISFNKGCYPGQEQIAKTQYRGRLRSQLFRLEGRTALSPGEALFSQPESRSSTATVVNCAAAGDRHFALAVVRLKAAEKGVLYGTSGESFEVHDIDYSL